MGERVLREACDHGRYESCDELITNGVPISPDGVKHPVFSWKPCPGGREVTINYEAAGRYLSTLIYDSDPDSTTHNEFLEYAMQEGHRIIDAALPDLEV